MKIQNITIVLRGTKGEAMKGVFDLDGNCISGSAEVRELMQSAIEEHVHGAADDAGDDAGDDSGLPSESGLGDETGDDAGNIDTSE